MCISNQNRQLMEHMCKCTVYSGCSNTHQVVAKSDKKHLAELKTACRYGWMVAIRRLIILAGSECVQIDRCWLRVLSLTRDECLICVTD